MDFSKEINGHFLEYYDDDHIYLVDGIEVPSVTQVLAHKFGKKYEGVSPEVLRARAEEGTRVHEAIELLCKTGEMTDLPEVRNFLFLKKAFQFEVVDNEVPVILFEKSEPICAGRLDLVIRNADGLGLADIKRTSVLDRDYLFYQLNIYKIAYEQCYWQDINFLAGLHLKDKQRRYAPIPMRSELAWEYIVDYQRSKDDSKKLE